MSGHFPLGLLGICVASEDHTVGVGDNVCYIVAWPFSVQKTLLVNKIMNLFTPIQNNVVGICKLQGVDSTILVSPVFEPGVIDLSDPC